MVGHDFTYIHFMYDDMYVRSYFTSMFSYVGCSYLVQGCQRNVEDWQKILQVRSLILTQQVWDVQLCMCQAIAHCLVLMLWMLLVHVHMFHCCWCCDVQEEVKAWVKFASICRKSGKMAMSETTLLSLLKHDTTFSQSNPVSLKYPQVCTLCLIHCIQLSMFIIQLCTENTCTYLQMHVHVCTYV